MYALTNVEMFTGDAVFYDRAILVERDTISSIVPQDQVPEQVEVIDLKRRSIAPGFIDIQVNGGADKLFNENPTVETIAAITKAHRRYGTTNCLPTYISGPKAGMVKAMEAVQACVEQGLFGVLGIHLEGPFLNPKKVGAHDRNFICPMQEDDMALVSPVSGGKTLLTLAPERVTHEWIRQMSQKGVIVSAGHTMASVQTMQKSIDSGVTGVTHLFNAMSPLNSREPGVVGAALCDDRVWCSVIVDGHHVDYTTLQVAWKAKGPRKMILITDAVSPVGGISDSFKIGENVIQVKEGKCLTEQGVLAGSMLDMAPAVRNCIQHLGIPKNEALRMASTYPAEFLGVSDRYGYLKKNYKANMVVFNNLLQVEAVIVDGKWEEVVE